MKDFLVKASLYFLKLFFNSKISYISPSLKKSNYHTAKRYRLVNICKTACCSNREWKNLAFWTYFRKKIWTILFINFTFFKLETQNGNTWSTAKTILRFIKFKLKIYRPVSYLLYDLDANLVFRLSGYTANYKIQKLSWRILILKKVFFWDIPYVFTYLLRWKEYRKDGYNLSVSVWWT